MKIVSFAKSLAFAAASVVAMNASAALEVTNVNPVQGTVGTLSTVTLELNGESLSVASNAATVADSNNNSFACSTSTARGGKVVVTMNETIATPETYTITIPANAISDSMSGDVNEEIKLVYTVTGVASSYPLTWGDVTPAPGKVETLTSPINISFESLTPIAVFDVNSKGATISGPDGEVQNVSIMANNNSGTVTIKFSEDLTTPGDYVVTIPEGWAVNTDGEGISPELKLNYTVEKKIFLTLGEGDFIVDPETDESLASLSQVRFFMQNGSEEFALVDPDNAFATATDAEGDLLATGKVSMQSVNTGRITVECLVVEFETPITTPGACTVTIPTGTLTAMDYDPDSESWDLVPVYFNAFSVTYNILALDDAKVTATPADGTRMDALVGTIDFAYDDLLEDGLYFDGGEDSVNAIVADAEGKTVATLAAAYGDVKGHVTVTIPEDEAISARGTYTVTIPQGSVRNASGDDFVGKASVTYYVGKEVRELDPMDYSADPEDGSELQSISEILISMNNGVEDLALVEETGTASLKNAKGDEVATAAVTLEEQQGKVGMRTVIMVRFAEAVTTPGEYTLTIPEATLMASDLDENYNLVDIYLGTITLNYVIPSPVFNVTTDPEDGSEVNALSSVTITFEGATSVVINDQASAADFPYVATVKDGGLEKVAQWTGFASDNTLTVKSFGTGVTEAGYYIVVVPPTFFTVDGVTPGEDLAFEYTVVAPKATFFYDFKVKNIEEESTVNELSTITFEYSAVDGEGNAITEGMTYKHNPVITPRVERVEGTEVVETCAGTITGEDPVLTWSAYYTVTNDGMYIFTVPAEYMTITNADGTSITNDDDMFMFFFEKKNNGVDSVEIIPVERDAVYNLQGVKMNVEFENLPAGIYVVNGKKVVKD